MAQGSQVPSRGSSALFWFKSSLLKLKRAAEDLHSGVTRLDLGQIKQYPSIVSESRTPLWSDNSLSEQAFQLGKMENLRVAARQLHGTVIPQGKVFSFWKQIGRATRRRGYVLGRQLREGCLYPDIGGGLCQLSNALYAAALDSRCEIVERHPHTRVIPGSAAEFGRDATVAWNYIDLRFRPRSDIVVEAFLTSSELIVRFRNRSPAQKFVPLRLAGDSRPVIDLEAHSCPTCGELKCFRHGGRVSIVPIRGKRAYFVDEVWPEFQAYLDEEHSESDVLLLPVDGARLGLFRYGWHTDGYSRIGQARLEVLRRSIRSRKLAQYGADRIREQLDSTGRIADALAERLSHDVTHLVVAQTFLPYLLKGGHLGGRTYDVLLTRTALDDLHALLDQQAALHPERGTLSEYRAPDWLVEAERRALDGASRVLTPHADLSKRYGGAKLDWAMPKKTVHHPGHAIAFPGPTAARKGAYELREAVRRLGCELVLLGSELEGEGFWSGVKTRRPDPNGTWLDGVGAVVQPALIEEKPRRLLQAMANGVPVVCTEECGLGETAGWTRVAQGDAVDLENSLRRLTP